MTKPRFSLIPQFSFRSITDVTPEFLEQKGIEFLMLDLDNTLAAYDEHVLAEDVSKWVDDIQANGTKLFLISNSTRTKRVESFANHIGVDYIMKSYKPSPKSLVRAMELTGFSSGVSALAGDQIMTDTLAANRAGVLSIVVRPRRLTNLFLSFRYRLEVPLRALCKNKNH